MPEKSPLFDTVRKLVARRTEPRTLFDDVRQVCTVVDEKDFVATVTNLVEHLGVGPFRCWHFRPPRLYDTTYRGKPASYSMQLAITWLEDMQWEVIAPVEGPTLYRDHLRDHGPGVQHLLMSTGAVPWEKAAQRLADRAHPFGQTAKLNAEVQIGRVRLPSAPNHMAGPLSLQFGYIDAERTLHTSIELTRYPLGLSERFSLRSGKAEYCIPKGNAHFETPLPNRRVGKVVKLTLVTRDVEATIRSWIELAGVDGWRISELGRERLRDLRVGGQPAAFGARIARTRIGQALIELVQPGEGRSPYHDVLENRGEVVASIGVSPGPDGFDALVDHCTRLGYEPKMGDSTLQYFGARRFIGTDLEIVMRRDES